MIRILPSCTHTITRPVSFYCKTISASVIFLLCTVLTLQAQTKWYVMPGASATGTGNTWADAIDLQTAINTAVAGDSVFVAQGTYTCASGQSFLMKEGVKIYGGFAGTELTLAARDLSAGYTSTLQGNNARVIYNDHNGLTVAAVLDGFTITNGYASYGAGMMNAGASPTVSNCIFAANNGGGLYNGSSSAIVVKCVFTGNTGTVASYGGGIGNAASPGAFIINCIFSENTGSQAGGIYVDGAPPLIVNCIFWGNTTSSFYEKGAAIYYGTPAAARIENCIIWGNTSGIYVSPTTTPPTITNNIIQGGYLGNLSADPLFADPSDPAGADNIWGTADDGFILQAGSPAFNGGTADTTGLQLPGTDMAGATRVQGNKVDIGAYEGSFSCTASATLYVDSSIGASGDGSSWATAFKTLDEALIAAGQCTNVDNIRVAKGTYQPTTRNSFSMLNNVKIYGGFPNGGGSFEQRNTDINTTILTGNDNSIIYNERINTTALLDGFTISGGTAKSGSGMYNLYASPTINNCVFSGNAASPDGGCGGGMYNSNASPVISNCIFSDNSASSNAAGGGGAIWNSSSSPVISNSIFERNTAAYGGTINNYLTSSPIIKNTVFVDNTAGFDGAAIGNFGTSLKLVNVTFANNTAGRGGGAIDNYGASLTINNSIFWGNTSVDPNKDIWFETGSLSITHSFTQLSYPGTGNILGSSSPFVNAAAPAGTDGIWYTADDGLTLPAGSPCIDAGTPDTTGLAAGDTDIAGNVRIVNSVIDMGAYEYDNITLPVKLTGFTGSLRNGVAGLQWKTDMETGFNHFEVEKSTDGLLFRPKGTVPAKGDISSYTFNTLQPEPKAYYRLRMADNDGSAEYSHTIILQQSIDNGILVYPNPATNQINIKVSKAGSMNIYTAAGRLVKTFPLHAGINTAGITELTPGVYYGLMNEIQVKIIKN